MAITVLQSIAFGNASSGSFGANVTAGNSVFLDFHRRQHSRCPSGVIADARRQRRGRRQSAHLRHRPEHRIHQLRLDLDAPELPRRPVRCDGHPHRDVRQRLLRARRLRSSRTRDKPGTRPVRRRVPVITAPPPRARLPRSSTRPSSSSAASPTTRASPPARPDGQACRSALGPPPPATPATRSPSRPAASTTTAA